MKEPLWPNPPSCPHCGAILERVEIVSGEPGPPVPGSWACCGYCARFSIVAEDGSLRIGTLAEVQAVEASPAAAVLHECRERVLAAIAKWVPGTQGQGEGGPR